MQNCGIFYCVCVAMLTLLRSFWTKPCSRFFNLAGSLGSFFTHSRFRFLDDCFNLEKNIRKFLLICVFLVLLAKAVAELIAFLWWDLLTRGSEVEILNCYDSTVMEEVSVGEGVFCNDVPCSDNRGFE